MLYAIINPKSKINELVSILLYDAGFEKYMEWLLLDDVPMPPIPRLLNEAAGSSRPILNLE